MTTGSTGYNTQEPHNGACGPSMLTFVRTTAWTGADRSITRIPRKEGPVRLIPYTVTEKVEGHLQKVTKFREVREYESYTDFDLDAIAQQNAPHPFSKEWVSQTSGLTSYRTYRTYPDEGLNPWLFGAVAPCGFNAAVPPPVWDSSDDYKLISKLGQRVNGEAFNLASFVGAEGKDTLNLITGTSTRIFRSLLAMKKGKVHKALSILGASNSGFQKRRGVKPKSWYEEQLDVYKRAYANLRRDPKARPGTWYTVLPEDWLTYHLAVEPLVMDVRAAAMQLAHQLEVPKSKSYTAIRAKSNSKSGKSVSYTDDGPMWGINTWNKRVKVKLIVSEFASVPRLLGLYNPEIVVWNAIPLSFVADWFIPVGDWLEARGAAQAMFGTFVTSTKVWYHYAGLYAKPYYYQNKPQGYASINAGAFAHNGSFGRTVSQSLPVPLPTAKGLQDLAEWSKATAAARAVTAVSLAVTIGTRGSVRTY